MRGRGRDGRFPDYVYTIFMLALFLVAWQTAVIALKIPNYLIPTPLQMFSRLVTESPLLATDIKATASEALLGFGFCILIAVPFSILIVWFRTLERAIMPLLIFTQTTPMLAVVPILIIWFGIGILPKIIVVFIIGFFQLTVLTISGLRSVEPEMLDLMRSMSASTYDIFRKVRLPASLPYIFDGMKLAALLSVVGAVVAEIVGADFGLGHVIVYGISEMDTEILFGCILLLTAMGAGLFYSIVYVEKIVLYWHVAMRKQEFVRDVG